MPNKYGISNKNEEEIRKRDKLCVYCHKAMKKWNKNSRSDSATIEHLNNEGPFNEKSNLVICCGACNSSRRNKELLIWFKESYCLERNINEKTVAEPVKEYIKFIENFINRLNWKFAKTMPDIPHYYVVKENLSEEDQKTFDDFNNYIKKVGYYEMFVNKNYNYIKIGDYKYWIIENILNRAKNDNNV